MGPEFALDDAQEAIVRLAGEAPTRTGWSACVRGRRLRRLLGGRDLARLLVLGDDGRPVVPGGVGRLAKSGYLPLGYRCPGWCRVRMNEVRPVADVLADLVAEADETLTRLGKLV
jgi:hypothetical protein